MAITKEDMWTVACTVFWEAGGEPDEGKVAVAWVIVNRQRHHIRWRGYTLAGICTAPKQFSCYNGPAPLRDKLALTLDNHVFAHCLRLTIDVLTGAVADVSKSATHYLNVELTKKLRGGGLPKWAADPHDITRVNEANVTARIGQHTFLTGVA